MALDYDAQRKAAQDAYNQAINQPVQASMGLTKTMATTLRNSEAKFKLDADLASINADESAMAAYKDSVQKGTENYLAASDHTSLYVAGGLLSLAAILYYLKKKR